MKKRTVIVIVLLVLAAAVIALSVLGAIGQKDRDPSSFTATCYTGFPVVSSPRPITSTAPGWDHSFPTSP